MSSTGGEITEQADKLLEELEALEEAVPQKAERIEGYHEHLEFIKDNLNNSAEYYARKADHYRNLGKRMESQQDRLKSLLISLLDNTEGKKIEREGKANLTLVERDYLKVDEKRANIDILIEEFGEEVVKRTIKLDKKKLSQAVKGSNLTELPQGLYYETSKWIRGL